MSVGEHPAVGGMYIFVRSLWHFSELGGASLEFWVVFWLVFVAFSGHLSLGGCFMFFFCLWHFSGPRDVSLARWVATWLHGGTLGFRFETHVGNNWEAFGHFQETLGFISEPTRSIWVPLVSMLSWCVAKLQRHHLGVVIIHPNLTFDFCQSTCFFLSLLMIWSLHCWSTACYEYLLYARRRCMSTTLGSHLQVCFFEECDKFDVHQHVCKQEETIYISDLWCFNLFLVPSGVPIGSCP